MAKIVIAGDAAVVTSELKLEDIRKVAEYRPDALVLRGGEDGKEPIFKIGVTDGTGKINKYGAEFGSETHDDAKLATITLDFRVILGDFGGDVREAVAEAIGTSILNLNKLEETLPAVLAEIEDEKATILSNITIVQ